jgi:hypothetical protein
MSHFSFRKYLRSMTKAQRRAWWAQRLRLTPKVPISNMPHSFVRQHAYTSQARLK